MTKTVERLESKDNYIQMFHTVISYIFIDSMKQTALLKVQ